MDSVGEGGGGMIWDNGIKKKKKEFQRIARTDKKAFLNEQCKEIKENKRMGKTRDLFKKIGDTKGTFLHCWWECKLVQLLWKTVWRFLKKLRTELPHDPANPPLDIYPGETRIERDTDI